MVCGTMRSPSANEDRAEEVGTGKDTGGTCDRNGTAEAVKERQTRPHTKTTASLAQGPVYTNSVTNIPCFWQSTISNTTCPMYTNTLTSPPCKTTASLQTPPPPRPRARALCTTTAPTRLHGPRLVYNGSITDQSPWERVQPKYDNRATQNVTAPQNKPVYNKSPTSPPPVDHISTPPSHPCTHHACVQKQSQPPCRQQQQYYSPPPPPNPNGEAIRVWCPLGPLVYAGCSAAASAASTGGTQGREALFAPWCPSTCPRYALGRGEPDPARVAAPPVPKAVKECGSDPSRATYHRLPVPIGSRGVVG